MVTNTKLKAWVEETLAASDVYHHYIDTASHTPARIVALPPSISGTLTVHTVLILAPGQEEYAEWANASNFNAGCQVKWVAVNDLQSIAEASIAAGTAIEGPVPIHLVGLAAIEAVPWESLNAMEQSINHELMEPVDAGTRKLWCCHSSHKQPAHWKDRTCHIDDYGLQVWDT